MGESSAPLGRLVDVTWRPLTIAGENYLLKVLFRQSSFDIVLTDCVSVWHDTAVEGDIRRRNEEYNAQLEIEIDQLLVLLNTKFEEIFASGEEKILALSRSSFNSDVRLQIQFPLSFCDFRWKFLLKRFTDLDSATFLREQLIFPLLFVSNFLSREVEDLRNVIENKDALINDFRTRRSPSKKMLPWANPHDCRKFSYSTKEERWSAKHNAFASFPSLYTDYFAKEMSSPPDHISQSQSILSQSLYSQELNSPSLGSPPEQPIGSKSSSSSSSSSTVNVKKEKAVLSPSAKGQTEKERKRELKRKLERAPEKEAQKRRKALPKII